MRFLPCRPCIFFIAISLLLLTTSAAVPSDETSFGSQIFASSDARDVVITFGGNDPNPDMRFGLLEPESIIFGSMDELPLNYNRNLEKFRKGEELIFYITNNSDPRSTFFTGPAGRNPDKRPHAQVMSSATGLRVGFEESYGGGDGDFDDIVFYLSGDLTTVPPRPSIPYVEARPTEAPVQIVSASGKSNYLLFLLYMAIFLSLLLIGVKVLQPATRHRKESRSQESGESRTDEPQYLQAGKLRQGEPLLPEALPEKKQLIRPERPQSGESRPVAAASPESSQDYIMIDDIDTMEGKEFAFFLKVFFQKQGYSVEMVPLARRNGADLIVKRADMTTAIQAKRQGQRVDHASVEQVYSAKKSARANQAWIMTNNHFTDDAKQSASVSGVKLFDRDDVTAMIGNSPVSRDEFFEKYEIWKSYM